MSSAIANVEGLKVTDENPPRDDVDGLDFQRCAALHNAIVEHGWTRSGRSLDAMPRTTWWASQHDNTYRDATTSHLHPSLIEFLKHAFHFHEKDFSFFHYLTGLQGVGPDVSLSFKEDGDSDNDYRYFTLYCTDQTHASNPDGLIYDQDTHTCLLSLNIDDFNPDENLPWQKLESVLTVYIEMIESGKIVAFHKDLEFPDDWGFYNAPDPAPSGYRVASQRPDAMLVDPVSGYAKKKGCVDPWTVVSSTETDLSESLEMWKILVEAIHDRMGDTDLDVEPVYGLANDQFLNAMPDGLAKSFFAGAMKPRFRCIAPGLRIQTPEELADQPYATSFLKEGTSIPPILLFRGEGSATPTVPFWDYPHISIPAGLYFEPCDTFDDAAPWEDGVALILPYNVGGHGSWARMADQQPLPERNDSLYQIGRDPFVAPHPTQLVAVLENWYSNLMLGNWEVDENGVTDGIDKYHEANMEEHCMEYVVYFGPGLPV